ncbi:conditioned medium-induced protein 4 [Halobaculum sp. MBLA0143]|uniref:conditioned medium-induced protein 4 n=1 Tax=Halobaculum sp. MBLA0143 TaxID=3079933 RepID=UPI0035255EA0
MDEKTAELRDIFVETTGEESVTEDQSADRGSLLDDPDDDRVRAVLATLREETAVETDLPLDAHERVVRLFFEGLSDAEIATELDCSAEAVFRARLDAHLVAPSDRETTLDRDRLRRLVREEISLAERAAAVDADETTVTCQSAVIEAEIASTRHNHRFRDELATLLSDAPLADKLASGAREDGLREATEDIETDVQL